MIPNYLVAQLRVGVQCFQIQICVRRMGLSLVAQDICQINTKPGISVISTMSLQCSVETMEIYSPSFWQIFRESNGFINKIKY